LNSLTDETGKSLATNGEITSGNRAFLARVVPLGKPSTSTRLCQSMPNGDVPLHEAPERFFDPALWKEYLSFFPTRESALEELGPRPGHDDFYLRDAAKHPPATPGLQATVRRLKLKQDLVEAFRELLVMGKLVATGFSRLAVEEVTIPAGRWRDLWPDFIHDKATSDILEFTGVWISEPATAPATPSLSLSEPAAAPATPSLSLMQRCLEWMRQRAQGGESRKKVLKGEAMKLFGDDLTTRTFDSVYKEIFSKPRGRPRGKAP
jgi:hypothetical protein